MGGGGKGEQEYAFHEPLLDSASWTLYPRKLWICLDGKFTLLSISIHCGAKFAYYSPLKDDFFLKKKLIFSCVFISGINFLETKTIVSHVCMKDIEKPTLF